MEELIIKAMNTVLLSSGDISDEEAEKIVDYIQKLWDEKEPYSVLFRYDPYTKMFEHETLIGM